MILDLDPIKKRHDESEQFCRDRRVRPPECHADRAALIFEVEVMRKERAGLLLELAKLDPEALR